MIADRRDDRSPSTTVTVEHLDSAVEDHLEHIHRPAYGRKSIVSVVSSLSRGPCSQIDSCRRVPMAEILRMELGQNFDGLLSPRNFHLGRLAIERVPHRLRWNHSRSQPQ